MLLIFNSDRNNSLTEVFTWLTLESTDSDLSMNSIKTINPLHSLAEAIALFESIRTLDEAGNRVVRAGIRNNLITFPSEVPVFKKTTRPDLQAKIAVLYFIRGWSTSQIGDRYGIGRQRVAQIVTKWRVRAVRHGYVQLINEATLVPARFLEELQDEATVGAAEHAPTDRDDPRSAHRLQLKASQLIAEDRVFSQRGVAPLHAAIDRVQFRLPERPVATGPIELAAQRQMSLKPGC